MKRYRFQLRYYFYVTAAICLWLATLTGFTGSNDILALAWTAIVVGSGVAAAYSRARRQAFWLGFFGTMLLASMRTVFDVYGAKLRWTTELSRDLGEILLGSTSGRGQLVLNLNTTLIFLTLIASATAIGYFSTWVFDRCQDRQAD